MNHTRLLFTCALALSALFGCDQSSFLTGEERSRLMEFVLTPDMPVPPSPTNRFADDPAAAVLGQKLFYDTRFAGPLLIGADVQNGGLGAIGDEDKVSCSSCHDMANGAADTRSRPNATSLGVKYTPRNSPTMYNMAWLTFNHMDGRKHTIWGGCSAPIEGALGSTRMKTVHRLQELYSAEYEAVFGEALPDFRDLARFPPNGKPGQPAWDQMVPDDKQLVLGVLANYGKATEAYLRLVVDRNSAFDRFMTGELDAMTPEAIQGMRVFIGRGGCDECHNGPTFSDHKFHNIGVPQVGDYVSRIDPGRASGVNQVLNDPLTGIREFSDDPTALAADFETLESVPADLLPGNCGEYATCGAFKTPSLRSIGRTSPYMHTGAIETLWDVVDFYNDAAGTDGFVGTRDPRVAPLDLTDEEMNSLVEFLRSLDGEPIPTELTVSPELP